MKCHLKSLLMVVVALGLALPAPGQEVPVGSPGFSNPAPNAGPALELSTPAPAYGTSVWTVLNSSMMGFTPLDNGEWSHFGSTGWSYRNGGTNTAACTDVHLPSGALLQYITTWTNDTDAANDITYTLFDVNLATNTGTTPFTWTSSGTPGIQRVARAVSPNITINNDRHTYTLCIFHPATGSTLQSAGVSFWYLLQVSPAPATATFTDVPTSYWAFQYIEALRASGITQGVTPTTYEPESNVTRAQMAVFLAKALGLHFPY